MSPNIGGIRPRDSLRPLRTATMASSRRLVGGTNGRPSDSSASLRICCALSQLVCSSTTGQPHHSLIPARSWGDTNRRDGGAAEGRDEGRVLARSAGYGDVDVLRRARDPAPVAVRLVAGG